MGDGADDAFDQMLNELEDDKYYEPGEIKCGFCGCKGLYWQETERGWRLATSTGKLHECSAYLHLIAKEK